MESDNILGDVQGEDPAFEDAMIRFSPDPPRTYTRTQMQALASNGLAAYAEEQLEILSRFWNGRTKEAEGSGSADLEELRWKTKALHLPSTLKDEIVKVLHLQHRLRREGRVELSGTGDQELLDIARIDDDILREGPWIGSRHLAGIPSSNGIMLEDGKLFLWAWKEGKLEQIIIPTPEGFRILYGRLVTANVDSCGPPPTIVGKGEASKAEVEAWLTVNKDVWALAMKTARTLCIGVWPSLLQIRFLQDGRFVNKARMRHGFGRNDTLLGCEGAPEPLVRYIMAGKPMMWYRIPESFQPQFDPHRWWEADSDEYLRGTLSKCQALLDLQYGSRIEKASPMDIEWGDEEFSNDSAELFLYYVTDAMSRSAKTGYLLSCELAGVKPCDPLIRELDNLLDVLNKLLVNHPTTGIPIPLDLIPYTKIRPERAIRCVPVKSWNRCLPADADDMILIGVISCRMNDYIRDARTARAKQDTKDELNLLLSVHFYATLFYGSFDEDVHDNQDIAFHARLIGALHRLHQLIAERAPYVWPRLLDVGLIPPSIRVACARQYDYTPADRNADVRSHLEKMHVEL
ncbi:hypothetical protein CALCODRAFT_539459, partial [Calocera cornea HHB12733]